MTEFVNHLSPPGETIKLYNRSLPATQQPRSVPQTFLDAMYVREEVFVNEQNVPLDREVDDEDAVSHHFVVYASVGAPKGQEATVQRGFGAPSSSTSTGNGSGPGLRHSPPPPVRRQRSESTATRLPIGVIRIVPPHYPGSRNNSPATSPVPSEESGYPAPTVFPGEPYIRLGRLATLKDYRGMGLSPVLVNNALQYARQHPSDFKSPLSAAEQVERSLQGYGSHITWNGLVYVHAQKERTVQLWKKFGFVEDEGMGTWDEEGMDHVGMWKRLVLENP